MFRTLLGTTAIAGVLSVAALATAAPASADPVIYEDSVYVNGTLKAHSVWNAYTNTLCINLTNAPNGGQATVELYTFSGNFVDQLADNTSNGSRVCSLESVVGGNVYKMVTRFFNGNHVLQGTSTVYVTG